MPGPLVAVSAYHLPAGQVQRWRRGGYGLPETYVAGVRRAGGVPVLLPPGHPGAAGELLERFDGLLLAGGGDLDPARYGVPRHPATERVDAERDDLELGLARAAAERGLPTLGICRGMQVLNVAFGGSLCQHLPEVGGLLRHAGDGGEQPRHRLRVQAGSRLAEAVGGGEVVGFSQHHQGVDRVGEGLAPVAWADDGLIEGLESANGGGWTVGVLWHPEETAAADPAQQRLLAAFVAQAARFGGRRPTG